MNKASAVLSECVISLERGDSEITHTIREGQRYKPKAKQYQGQERIRRVQALLGRAVDDKERHNTVKKKNL